MRILFLMDQMYLHGGGEQILSQKINYLLQHFGYDVHLITSEQKNKESVYNLDAKLKWKDLDINYYRGLSYFHPKNLLKSITHFSLLKKEILRIQPDIIVSVSFSPEQYFLPFIQKKIPKIKEFHSSGVIYKAPVTLMDKLKHQLFLLVGKYHAVVLLNEDEKKYYPFQKLRVIPNFITVPKTENQFVQREKTIIAAGRIAPVKQFDHLIRVWSQIAVNFPEWNVKIFGNGDEMILAELKNLIKKLGVPNIKLMGATTVLDQEMKKASVYAMTSATECFPMVLLEAQAAGLPVLSYDCPNGPRNIITQNQDGWLTTHNEITIFAEQLSKLIENESKRNDMGSAAKQNVIRFSREKIMEQWNALFIELQAKS